MSLPGLTPSAPHDTPDELLSDANPADVMGAALRCLERNDALALRTLFDHRPEPKRVVGDRDADGRHLLLHAVVLGCDNGVLEELLRQDADPLAASWVTIAPPTYMRPFDVAVQWGRPAYVDLFTEYLLRAGRVDALSAFLVECADHSAQGGWFAAQYADAGRRISAAASALGAQLPTAIIAQSATEVTSISQPKGRKPRM